MTMPDSKPERDDTAGQTDSDDEAPASEQDVNIDQDGSAEAGQDADQGDKNRNREAAKWRTKLRDAERERDELRQERDELRQQVSAMRQSFVDQIATASGLSDPGLLAYSGHSLESLLNEDGTVNVEKARAATAEVMRKHGIVRRTRLTPNPQQASGSGAPPRGSTSEQWARSFGPSR
jgi:hypothetical protein